MHKHKYIAYILLVVSSVIFGFSFLMTKGILRYLDVFQLLGIRFLTAALVMSIIVLTHLVKVKYTRRKMLSILLLALFQPIMYFVCETFGIKLTSSSESGMVIALIPIFVAVFSRLMLKENLQPLQWISVFVSVMGVVLIVGAKGLSVGSGSILGFILLLGAVTAAGLYSPMSRKLSAHSTPYEITFVMMWVGAVVFNTIGMISAGQNGTLNTYFTDALKPGALGGLLYLSILSSIVAFFCINYAVSKIKAGVTASFANLTTVISILAGVLIGGESILPMQIAGIVLILLSIWGVVRGRLGKDREGDGVSEIIS